MNKSIYLSDVKRFLKDIGQGLPCSRRSLGLGFNKVQAGICSLYRWYSIPLLVAQDNPNFKSKIFVGSVPLFTKKKKPIIEPIEQRYSINASRRNRVYINVGSLPFFDNGSGIPRVAKELANYGLVSRNCDVYPVYADPVTGIYKFAAWWARDRGLCTQRFESQRAYEADQDAAIDLVPGDWLIHTMINPNEIEVETDQFAQMKASGVRLGFILHDLIPERHPEFFKNRDAKNFSRWLRLVRQYDAVFAVSRATLSDYQSWLEENGCTLGRKQVQEWFHLGSDFQAASSAQDVDPKVLEALRGKSYVLQVSTIEPRKGYAQLLSAFEELWANGSEESLVIVGRKGWKVASLCRRIRRHPELGKRLFWFTGINDATLKALYGHASVIMAASEAEGFGLSVVEGAAFGRPLLVRDIPSFREVAPKGTSFFSGTSPSDLARAIINVDRTKVPDSSEKPKTWKESAEALFSIISRIK